MKVKLTLLDEWIADCFELIDRYKHYSTLSRLCPLCTTSKKERESQGEHGCICPWTYFRGKTCPKGLELFKWLRIIRLKIWIRKLKRMKKAQKCLPFPEDHDSGKYEKYFYSHDWGCEKEREVFLHVCKKCKAVRQNPSGTLDFMFGCKLISLEDLKNDRKSGAGGLKRRNKYGRK